MKLALSLLAASLATSVSAKAYELCCCSNPANPKDLHDSRYFEGLDPKFRANNIPVKQCDHKATKAVLDSKPGQYAFSPHFWDGHPGSPRFKGDSYIYATGINGEDNLIGQGEMSDACNKQNAGRYCWTPGRTFLYNYKGEYRGFPGGSG